MILLGWQSKFVQRRRVVLWALAWIFVSSAKAVAPSKKALTLANQGFLFGAGEMNRTPDLLITNEVKEIFAPVDLSRYTH